MFDLCPTGWLGAVHILSVAPIRPTSAQKWMTSLTSLQKQPRNQCSAHLLPIPTCVPWGGVVPHLCLTHVFGRCRPPPPPRLFGGHVFCTFNFRHGPDVAHSIRADVWTGCGASEPCVVALSTDQPSSASRMSSVAQGPSKIDPKQVKHADFALAIPEPALDISLPRGRRRPAITPWPKCCPPFGPLPGT